MAVLIAAAVALGWCLLAIRLGPLLGFVDRPDDTGLKPHGRPVVPLGGVGVFLGVHVALIVAGRFDAWLLAASTLVLVVGLVDDRRTLSPATRLALEGVAGVLVGIRFFDGVGIAVAALLVVAAVNAVNLFDGLDGLVGSTAVVSGIGFAWLASNRGLDPMFGFALAGAAAGFLVLNWHPARVFLGDNGSYVVGLLLVYGLFEPVASLERLGPNLIILGVFALDLAATIVRRGLARLPLSVGDRGHLYDRLHDRGLGVRSVALTVVVAQSVFVVAAVLIDRMSFGLASWLLVGTVGLAAFAAVAAGGFLRSTHPPSTE